MLLIKWKRMYQNDTPIPCSICRLHGNLLWAIFVVWHLIKNGWGLLFCHMLPWGSGCTKDQTQGAGKHPGRFTDFIIVVLSGWSCVRSFNPIPGTNKRNNSQSERPKRTYKLLHNNQINARALIGQSAMVYCASKLMEKSRVFWIII